MIITRGNKMSLSIGILPFIVVVMFLIIVINFLFFINVSNVSAITCADIDQKISDYNATVTDK